MILVKGNIRILVDLDQQMIAELEFWQTQNTAALELQGLSSVIGDYSQSC